MLINQHLLEFFILYSFSIKTSNIDENGVEFWYARELQSVLDYKEWRKFDGVIQRAIKACKNSNINASDHFVGADKMVSIGSGATRKQIDDKNA